MNPFKYGRVVVQDDFCPRPALMKTLKSHIKSRQNTLIEGERRVGKTSLIINAIKELRSHKMLYIDLNHVSRYVDLCRRIANALISFEKGGSTLLKRVIGILGQLRPSFTVDPVSGQPSLTLDASSKYVPDSMEGLLDAIESLPAKNRVVVFDEFQDILHLENDGEILALMRSRIQFHQKSMYLFAGSIRNQMNEIFNDAKSPFFKSAATISIGAIERRNFSRFLTSKMASGERQMKKETIDLVFELADDVPGDVQQLCAALWETSARGSIVTPQNMEKALDVIFGRELKGYEAVLGNVTGNQQRCLVNLAKFPEMKPTSTDFIRAAGISQPSSIARALQGLHTKRVLFHHQGKYRFVNPFFKHWLRRQDI